MSYEPFKSIGARTFTTLSGSGTLQTVGNTMFESALNVTGALTLDGPASGSAAGPRSYLAVDSNGLVVLDQPSSTVSNGAPAGCLFKSSTTTEVELNPTGSDNTAVIPIIHSDGTLLNVTLTTQLLTASLTSSGVAGVDVGASATPSVGYYTYLITQDDGVNPELLLSRDSLTPTLPATYTYKSQALFFNFVSSDTTWRLYVNRTDGWTYGKTTIGTNLKEYASETVVDAREMVPANGRFVLYVNGKWDQDNNKTLRIYKNINMTLGDATGEPDEHENISNFRKNTNGTGDMIRDWAFGLSAPPSGSEETFYYKWNASLSAGAANTGADFYAIAWKTEAFNNPQE